MNSKNNRRKIAFLTSADPQNRRSWSGIYYYMAQAIQKYCGDVTYLGPVNIQLPKLKTKFLKKTEKISQKLFKKRYNYKHSIWVSQEYSKVFRNKLLNDKFDLIFAPTSSTEIAFLKTQTPIVYLSDTTFSLMDNYYRSFSNIVNKFEGNIIEKLACQKASLLLYPTKWAAQSAINDYSVPEEKIGIIPFGANINNIPQREDISDKKSFDVCRLLFLGVDWDRKGGEIAFDALLNLEKLGITSELIVCGCTPPSNFSHKMMKVIPFLDKNDERQLTELENLLLKSHFLLLPTRSECYGIVFCEANAFGLPVITTDTGGVSGVITNNKNGFMLPLSARGTDYAKIIYEIYKDKQRYHKLMISSRETFEQKLNWTSWGIAFNKQIFRLL